MARSVTKVTPAGTVTISMLSVKLNVCTAWSAPGARNVWAIVVTFLALLEMIRLKLVRVFQSGAMGPIRVYKRARPADAPKPLLDPEKRHADEVAAHAGVEERKGD